MMLSCWVASMVLYHPPLQTPSKASIIICSDEVTGTLHFANLNVLNVRNMNVLTFLKGKAEQRWDMRRFVQELLCWCLTALDKGWQGCASTDMFHTTPKRKNWTHKDACSKKKRNLLLLMKRQSEQPGPVMPDVSVTDAFWWLLLKTHQFLCVSFRGN